jgi:hypothetical protein
MMAKALSNGCKDFPFSTKSLVIGSSVMASFFSSAIQNAAPTVKTYTKSQIIQLIQSISGIHYTELAPLYPQNPTFLYGADKLLLVVLILMELGGFESVLPTNASLSRGLVYSLLLT